MQPRKTPLRAAVGWLGDRRAHTIGGQTIVYRCPFGDTTGTVDESGPPPVCPHHRVPMIRT